MSAVLKPYMPRRNSLAGRVVEFFQRNPEEELTRKDVADKFGFTPHAVDTGLQAAVDAGLLRKAKSADSTVVWCCGPRGKRPDPLPMMAPAAGDACVTCGGPSPFTRQCSACMRKAADARPPALDPKASSAAGAARTEGPTLLLDNDDETLVGGFAPQLIPAAPAERRMTLSLEVTMHEAEMIFSVLRCAGRVVA